MPLIVTLSRFRFIVLACLFRSSTSLMSAVISLKYRDSPLRISLQPSFLTPAFACFNSGCARLEMKFEEDGFLEGKNGVLANGIAAICRLTVYLYFLTTWNNCYFLKIEGIFDKISFHNYRQKIILCLPIIICVKTTH